MIVFMSKPKSQRQQMTAIITDKRGRVLSIGQNSYLKTHPWQARIARKMGDPEKVYLHAEIHAITRCVDLTKAYKISVFRYNSNGTPVMAKPCPICQDAIKQSGIKVIEHT